ncbi:DUF5666 domain-containing protein [Vibrio splendidus]|uniref:DUF5666 domain-containing protein n=1 Tax=Vibrio splendidus TaxID=29497 RepID=UPI000769E51A|nr:DUF5666 domain-containing protein [Vibrio splendidus]
MKKLALISAVGLILTGCGGSDSNSNGSNDNNTQAPSAVQGTIDSVSGNTIVVNGYSYQVDSATYAGKDVAIADLERNMMVSISSNARSTNEGTQLTLEPTIVGRIANTDHVNGTFEINNIPLTFSALSSEIEDHDWVMVSSLPTADKGYKVLSVIKFESSNLTESVEVEGLISELDSNAKTFKLGANLSVEYTINSFDKDFNESELADDLWVEVRGIMVGSVLHASKIEIEDFDELGNGTEIEGTITSVANDKSSFRLSFKGHFLVDENTRYEDGSKSKLTVDTEVEVTTKKVNGRNVATEIEFEHDVDFEGTVQNINLEGSSFEMTSLDGNQTIHVNKNTQFEDGLTFENLAIGDLIEVEAYKVNNQYIASEIEADDND